MKKSISFLSLFIFLLSACTQGEDLGIASYSPAFGWVKEQAVPLVKTFEFEFSNDALQAPNTVFAEFQFVDNNGNPISTKEMQVYDDEIGKFLSNNTFRITPKDKSKVFKFFFTKQAKTGIYQGKLKLCKNNLHRIENEEVSADNHPLVHQWTIHFKKKMNPLAKGLMWVMIALGILLVLWFACLRPQLYPHFPKAKKTLIVVQNGQRCAHFNIVLTGKRIVYIANKKVRQSLFSRIFTGKIETKIDSRFVTPLKLTPKRKNILATGNGYIVKPNPIPRNGLAEIYHIQQNLQVNIN